MYSPDVRVQYWSILHQTIRFPPNHLCSPSHNARTCIKQPPDTITTHDDPQMPSCLSPSRGARARVASLLRCRGLPTWVCQAAHGRNDECVYASAGQFWANADSGYGEMRCVGGVDGGAALVRSRIMCFRQGDASFGSEVGAPGGRGTESVPSGLKRVVRYEREGEMRSEGKESRFKWRMD
ncbi:hypothetical protein EJ04DRAFT_548302 [Polyplosphaeria fusca]|uniref:Uncharacterized protein n=1 Tax=Polyplosphaeria fusca TaxID=682080 RepID=A0A9P4RC87_9PLEO|nr:hypothetical protein EJ04DRAFT_548302 [Polyplosphaeria fusca]